MIVDPVITCWPLSATSIDTSAGFEVVGRHDHGIVRCLDRLIARIIDAGHGQRCGCRRYCVSISAPLRMGLAVVRRGAASDPVAVGRGVDAAEVGGHVRLITTWLLLPGGDRDDRRHVVDDTGVETYGRLRVRGRPAVQGGGDVPVNRHAGDRRDETSQPAIGGVGWRFRPGGTFSMFSAKVFEGGLDDAWKVTLMVAWT